MAIAAEQPGVGTPPGDEPLDAHALRAEFPILGTTVHGRPLIYLDSAATSQKPATNARKRYFTRLVVQWIALCATREATKAQASAR